VRRRDLGQPSQPLCRQPAHAAPSLASSLLTSGRGRSHRSRPDQAPHPCHIRPVAGVFMP
jgi:hypothetical protein